MIRSLFLRLLPAIMSTLTQLCFVNVINPYWRVIMHWRKCNDTPPYSKVSVKNCWKVGGIVGNIFRSQLFLIRSASHKQWQKRSGSETFDLRRCVGARYVRVLTSIDRGRVQSTLTQRYRQFGEELLGYFLKEHDVKGFEWSLAS